MSANIERLRASAKIAGGCGMDRRCEDPAHEWFGWGELYERFRDTHDAHETASFIAAARPSVVLALLDEVEALRAKVARVEALVEAEIADAIESNVRSETASVRCLDCDLRYEERQEYGCGESGRGHHYDAEDIADAEASARSDAIEYVTVPIADLRAALGDDAARAAGGAA